MSQQAIDFLQWCNREFTDVPDERTKECMFAAWEAARYETPLTTSEREEFKLMRRVAAKHAKQFESWMPIVAASGEHTNLPDGWTWREPWKFTAEGPNGVVCEPHNHMPWFVEGDAPKIVTLVVAHRAASVVSSIEANQWARRLNESRRWRPMSEVPDDCERIEACGMLNDGTPYSYTRIFDAEHPSEHALAWRPFGNNLPTEEELEGFKNV